MNIYAEDGDKVVYMGGPNGNDSDHNYIAKMGVKIGDVLTVDHTEISGWHTEVMFQEIPGYHNSVMFEDFEEAE